MQTYGYICLFTNFADKNAETEVKHLQNENCGSFFNEA